MKKIFITRQLQAEKISELNQDYEIDIWPESEAAIPREELLRRVAGSHAIICMLTDKIDKELLDAAGDQLEVVSTMSVGFDHVDTDELKSRNIRLGYTPNVLTDSVADLTVALMLASSRRLPEAITAAKDGSWGTWAPYWMTGQDLSQSTVGIVGLGAIGAEVARRLSGFKCKILYSSRNRKESIENELGIEYVDQNSLLSQSDFVSVHSALTNETAELCNQDFFSRMKNTAVFINTSRGGLVNQDDLYNSLEKGDIYAAGIDVTTPEPLPLDSPLLTLDNCIVLPHIGSASIRTRQEMTRLALSNALKGLEGSEMEYEVKV